jgi:hypothetical protein
MVILEKSGDGPPRPGSNMSLKTSCTNFASLSEVTLERVGGAGSIVSVLGQDKRILIGRLNVSG